MPRLGETKSNTHKYKYKRVCGRKREIDIRIGVRLKSERRGRGGLCDTRNSLRYIYERPKNFSIRCFPKVNRTLSEQYETCVPEPMYRLYFGAEIIHSSQKNFFRTGVSQKNMTNVMRYEKK